MGGDGDRQSNPDPVAAAMAAIFDDLVALHRAMVEAGERQQACLDRIHPNHRAGARNLLYYLEMRRQDLRRLQTRLAELGLSSLGRAEVHALDNVEAVLALVRHRLARPWPERGPDARRAEIDRAGGYDLLARHAEALFGPVPDRRDVRIMVTMPRAAADDGELIGRLMDAGMDLIRINTGHDEPVVWERMLANRQRAVADRSCPCRVLIDLAGPKVRTTRFHGPAADAEVVRVRPDDTVVLVDDARCQTPVREDAVHVGCSHPSIFAQVAPGDRIVFDDGRFATETVEVGEDHLVLSVTRARTEKGEKLKLGKGLNAVGVRLDLPALSEADHAHLDFVAAHCDIAGLSFVQTAADVRALDAQLDRRDADDVGILLKIETPVSFHNLPELLLTAMRRPLAGVMVARGDLAVEVGFERLAEVQEEILWLCEAAHLPVVWATEVLENKAKKGVASRGEITDAARAQTAECVMLNKGPQIVDAVASLDDILTRMHDHLHKKTPRLRRLSSWVDRPRLTELDAD